MADVVGQIAITAASAGAAAFMTTLGCNTADRITKPDETIKNESQPTVVNNYFTIQLGPEVRLIL